jgi:dTDP-4-dehydrorhamnose 3,5-epimerase
VGRLRAFRGEPPPAPAGFAHGFAVTAAEALVSYKCTSLYDPHAEGTLLWNDPDIGIDWGALEAPELSEKDRNGLRLRDLPRERLPVYGP